jgi:L-rhamnose mutarotase
VTERVCFLMHVRTDRLGEYTAAHAAVWPDMQQALTETGWHNYSLFVRPDDGLVVGYLETDDFDAALAGMAAHEVNDRWQAAMAPFFPADGDDGQSRPDQRMQRLTEYFHLA